MIMKKLVVGAALIVLLCACTIANVVAQEPPRPFVTKWELEADVACSIGIYGKQYKLVIRNSKNVAVVTVPNQSGPYTFTPAEDDVYTVEAGPEGVERFTTYQHGKSIKEVVDFGTVEWTTMEHAFEGAKDMNFKAGILPPNLAKVTSLERMFEGCENFNSPLSGWNVSKVTNMKNLFYNCHSFNQSLEGWDVSNVTDMEFMFGDCYVFTQPLAHFKVANVENMWCMFWECYAFNQPLEDWDVSKVRNMGNMFSSCKQFNQPLQRWNVGNVENFSGMFYGCDVFDQPLAGWNVSKAKDMNYMFYMCNAFNQPLEGWNVSNVENMKGMFSNCSLFNQPLAGWNVGKVKNMESMFSSSHFNQPIGSWNTANVENMENMFYFNRVFNQPIGNWKTSKVTNMKGMFQYCDAFNQPLEDWDMSNVENVKSMFNSCKSFNQPLGKWKLKKVREMEGLFMDCYSFNQPLEDWDVSKVENMSYMFRSCRSFNQPLSKWKTSKVTNMKGMFEHCYAFNQPLEDWDVSKVEDMTKMFFLCTSFNQPLGKWKVKTKLGLNHTAITPTNYSKTLIGWNTLGVKVEFGDDVKDLVYTAEAHDAHAALIANGCTLEGDKEEAAGIQIVDGADPIPIAVNQVREFDIETWGTLSGTPTVIVASGSENLEIVENTGNKLKIKGLKEGYPTLKATVGAYTHKRPVYVQEVKVQSIHVTAAKNRLNYGEKTTLRVEVQPSNATNNTYELTTTTTPPTGVATLDQTTWTVQAGNTTGKMTITLKSKEPGTTIPPATCVIEVVPPVYEVQLTKEGEGTLELKEYKGAALNAIPEGKKVTVIANPDEEKGFELKSLTATKPGKTEDLLTQNKQFTVDANTTVKAVFGKKLFKVSVNVKDGKGGTALLKGADDFDNVPFGTTLEVELSPAEGYQRKEILVNGTKLEEGITTFKVTQETTVSVEYELQKFDITTQVAEGQGSLKVNGQENLTGVEYGTTVRVETKADPGWELTSLMVDGVNIKDTKEFVAKKTVTVVAVFAKEAAKTYKVILHQPSKGGTIAIKNYTEEALNAVAENTELTVVATPEDAAKYELTELTANDVDIKSTMKFKVTKETHVRALFAEKTFKVETRITGMGELKLKDADHPDQPLDLDKVPYGTRVKVEAIPQSEGGWQLRTLTAGDENIFTTREFTVTKAVVVEAEFYTSTLKNYRVTLSEPAHGTLAIKDYTKEQLASVIENSVLTVIATPEDATKYELKELKANGVDIKATMTFKVTADTEVTAVFGEKDPSDPITYKVTLTQGAHGTISISGYDAAQLEKVEKDTELTVIATPEDATKYELKELKANGVDIKSTMTFKVTADTEVTAVFGEKDPSDPTTYKVTLTQGAHGTIAIEGYDDAKLEKVEKDTELTVIATPEDATKYELKELKANGVDIKSTMKFKVTADTEVTAVFGEKDPSDPTTYKVTLTQGAHGTISISGYDDAKLEKVEKDTELTVIATPEDATKYELKELKANGVDIKSTMKFKVTADTEVTAVFGEKQPGAVEDAVFASVVVAPNPFDSQLRIVNGELRGTYALLNAQGVVVAFGALEGAETRINTVPLPAGMYLLRLTAENGAQKTFSVVKR